MVENIFNWQFNTIPGNANQGAILMTRNDVGQPPFNQSDFIWKAMEDIIGVANVKFTYDESTNKFTLWKAKGHLDNEDKWSYNWESFGTFEGLSEETAEALRNLIYVDYRWDVSTEDDITTANMYGIRKDGTETLITSLTFVKKEYVDRVIANIKSIVTEHPLKYTDSDNTRTIGLNYNTDDFTVENNALKANIIDDTLDSSRIKTWSIDEIKDYVKIKWEYKGYVNITADLPSNAEVGSVYRVLAKNDLYVKLDYWYAFTQVDEAITQYAIELHKGTFGLYGKLRYDDIDFTIDNFNNLKSQIIDDTMGSADLNADKKTYSIIKILQLLSSAMIYKGQVATYSDLPATGNKNGDTWNVVDTGDNYAWNGTGWDKLSGEYIAGAGIVINGKTISATGISFIVGQGLQTTGAGSTATLLTKNGDGLEYDTNNANKVKAGSGITVNEAGVNVNTGNTTQTVNNNIEVKPYQGLINTAHGVSINTNLEIDPTPLESNVSGFVLHSDNKLEVKAGVIQPEFIGYVNWNRSDNTFGTLSSDLIARHNLFYIGLQTKYSSWTNWNELYSRIVSCENNSERNVALTDMGPQDATNIYAHGWSLHHLPITIDKINNQVKNTTSKWFINSWASEGVSNINFNWIAANVFFDANWSARLIVYGI